jgi:polyisoprenoid-binding protein YceI
MRSGVVLVSLVACLAPPAGAQLLPLPDATIHEGRLSFDGHATVGDFAGTTTTVTGALTGAADLAHVSGWVAAPVTTLRTGNDRRDRDLNKSMETEQYPELRFELTQVEPAAGSPDSLPATLLGRLILHGVTREIALPATLAFDDRGVRVRCDFPVNLKDYQIGGLSKMLGVLKMHEHIEVHVDLQFAFQTP